MKIEVDITPEEIANVISDIHLSNPKCKTFLEKVKDQVQEAVTIKYDEIQRIEMILVNTSDSSSS